MANVNRRLTRLRLRPARRPRARIVRGDALSPRRLWLAVVIAVIVTGVVAGTVLALGVGSVKRAPRFVPNTLIAAADPLRFQPSREVEFEQAAAAGLSHVLYVKSLGGVAATGKRVDRFRASAEQAVAGSGFSADMLEALVFLESAGRPDVIAGVDPVAASGLTQILAETGRDLLGMRIDLPASRRLTRRIAVAEARGRGTLVIRLQARRRSIDARFDPRRSLAGAVRYLSIARARFGRDDLAFVSYHMGIGNLEHVLRLFLGDASTTPIATLVAQHRLSWAEVFFDSSPTRHASAWRFLQTLSDDSKTYYWRLLAALQIIHLYRSDPATLGKLAALHDHHQSIDAVLHPPDATTSFASPSALKHAWANGLIQPLPGRPLRLHLAVRPSLGGLAARVGARPTLYRGLRVEALALLIYLAREVHEISGAPTPLIVSSAVSDASYQQAAGTAVSSEDTGWADTTGYAFTIRRRYGTGRQAEAFQYELERLQALNLIAWVRQPRTIHITVSSKADVLIPAMLKRAR